MMKSSFLPFLLLCFGQVVCTCQAEAFNIDGFYSGMTKDGVLQQINASHLEVKKSFFPNQITAGNYTLSFCGFDDAVAAITKTLSFKEFNSHLIELTHDNGNPEVDLPALDLDVIYLRWKTKTGDYALNSGFVSEKRFHNIEIIDNQYCHKR